MKFIFSTALMLVSLFLYSQAPACALTIAGEVIDHHNVEPLSFAEVVNLTSGDGVVADAMGRFTFYNLCQGQHSLVIRHVGCDPDTLEFNLRSDTTIRATLEHHHLLLKLLEIEAQAPHQDIGTYQSMDERSIAEGHGNSLADLLSTLPGVQTLQTGGNISKPMLRGLEGNRLVLVQNNAAVEGQHWGREHAPEIDPMVIESAEVVFGASGLRYGPRAMGGVVKTSMGEYHHKRTMNGWLRTGFQSNGSNSAGAVKLQGGVTERLPIFYQLAVSGNLGGDLKAPEYYLANTGRSNYNVHARAGWFGRSILAEVGYSLLYTDLGILSYAHVGNLTDLNNAISNGAPTRPSENFNWHIERPMQHITHETTSGRVKWTPALGQFLELKVSRQYNLRQEFDNSTFSTESADLQYELTTYAVDLCYERRFNEYYKTEAGISAQQQSNTYTGRFFIPNFRSQQLGGYSIHHVYFDNWEWEAGLRFDYRQQQAFMYREDVLYDPERDFSGTSLNTGISYAINMATISLNGGHSWRPPAINELYSGGLHHGAASLEFGDEELQEERMWSLTAAVVADTISQGLLKFGGQLGVYSYWFDQFIYLVPDQEVVLTIRGAFPSFSYQPIDAWMRGMDARIYTLINDRFLVELSGEFAYGTERNSGDNLLFIPPTSGIAQVSYIGTSRKLDYRLFINSIAVSRQGRAPSEEDYAPPPNGYVLFGSGLSAALPFSRSTLRCSLSINNILNTGYRNYLNRLRYFAHEPGRNFSIQIQFIF